MSSQSNLQTIKIATRCSPLALVQVDEIRALMTIAGINFPVNVVRFEPRGDVDQTTSLTDNVPDDFFTDALDQALLDKNVDIAVHSAKDLPRALNPCLEIYALTKSDDETDAFIGHDKFNTLKPGARIGTSSVIRRQELKALNPRLEACDIRGSISERIRQFEEGQYDGIIVAAIALKRLKLEKYIQDIMPWDAVALQGQLAVVGRRDNQTLKDMFSTMDVRTTYGSVDLVGAGPGDPELITLKGVAALKKADCVLYDYLAHKDILNHCPDAEKIYVGKRKGAHTLPQKELSKQLRQKAMAGNNVVRLKGGDPLVFGRGAEEIQYLRDYHIRVRVIPGVSAATAISSSLEVPLTARDTSSSVVFISGHAKDEKVASPDIMDIPHADTVVFFMGLTKLDVITASLKAADWPEQTPVMIVSKGTRPDQKVVVGCIADIRSKVEEEKVEPPALIFVGDVINFYRLSNTHQ